MLTASAKKITMPRWIRISSRRASRLGATRSSHNEPSTMRPVTSEKMREVGRSNTFAKTNAITAVTTPSRTYG